MVSHWRFGCTDGFTEEPIKILNVVAIALLTFLAVPRPSQERGHEQHGGGHGFVESRVS